MVIDNQRITLMHLCSRHSPLAIGCTTNLNGRCSAGGGSVTFGRFPLQRTPPAFACYSHKKGRVVESSTPLLYLLAGSISSTHPVPRPFIGWNTTTLFRRFMKLWVNFRSPLPPHRVPLHFSCNPVSLVLRLDEPHTPLASDRRSGCPLGSRSVRSLCDKIHFPVVAHVSRRLISSIPNSSCISESLAVSISSTQKTQFM